ncbi:MAG: zinc-binding dehydrogenase [Armatimonadetes bacterium]|nr:zinc-binding dehydrogenase [Armatimonadota bacterium]NIM23490.1 zinc-binding dehydrogenase [Armatimonadota bacterium]NIM67356.1 zinc-binding dehydrogenase [Armatimonadota bacterium]NIM75857.1 zinc-binding dehydrogenase [Armatimonadota bacterium]NIN05542.1 zinc-binding dehydrogenase [Armatimonadota bacterium]
MADKMKAVVLHKIDDLRIEEVPAPGAPGPDEVKVRTCNVGVCGSDVHYYKRGRIGDFVVKEPMILGHETGGEVIEVGSNVKNLKVGDKVAMEPGIPCWKCTFCKEGRYNLCQDIFFWATPPDHGSLAEYLVHPADFCFKLPEGVGTDEAAMIEPLAVGVHACNVAGVRPGSTVAVTGAGPIGLLAMQVALAYGATTAIATDVSPSRLALAEKLGAKLTINPAKEDVVKRVLAATEGEGVDMVLECSGAAQAISQSPYLVKPGGTIVWIGMTHPPEVEIDQVRLIINEIRTQGTFRYANAYPIAINLVAAGKVNLQPLITARYPFEKAVEAIDMCSTGKAEQIKVMIDF